MYAVPIIPDAEHYVSMFAEMAENPIIVDTCCFLNGLRGSSDNPTRYVMGEMKKRRSTERRIRDDEICEIFEVFSQDCVNYTEAFLEFGSSSNFYITEDVQEELLRGGPARKKNNIFRNRPVEKARKKAVTVYNDRHRKLVSSPKSLLLRLVMEDRVLPSPDHRGYEEIYKSIIGRRERWTGKKYGNGTDEKLIAAAIMRPANVFSNDRDILNEVRSFSKTARYQISSLCISPGFGQEVKRRLKAGIKIFKTGRNGYIREMFDSSDLF